MRIEGSSTIAAAKPAPQTQAQNAGQLSVAGEEAKESSAEKAKEATLAQTGKGGSLDMEV